MLMKKIFSLFVVGVVLFGTSVFAAEEMEESLKTEKSKPLFYVTLKGIYTPGKSHKEFEGRKGSGIGIDLGMPLAYGFAVELDGTYDKGDAKIIDTEDTVTIKYYTTSLDLAYVYDVTEEFGIIAKVGAEYEREKAETTETSTGVSGALGLEYELNERFNVVGEYEISSIKGPKGDMVMAGIKIKF